jgi:hypothetical protein
VSVLLKENKMKVTCIRDNGRPNEVPATKWVKKGEEYTVVNVMKCNVQGGIFGYELAELSLSGCEPYLYFSADRFGIPVGDKEKSEELQNVH